LVRLVLTKAALKQKGFNLPKLLRHVASEAPRRVRRREAELKLDECFTFFQTPEVLDEENKWFCPACREHVRATKTMDVWKLPEILIVHLKRFTANSKIETHVNFPDVLDMRPFVCEKAGAPLNYRLYAVSEHGGSLCGGHYTAHALVWPEGAKAGNWFSFDDASVRAATALDAHSTNSYVLFYEKMAPGEAAGGHADSR
jgi:ubiquitin carboxyl-terminal hydrolase 4/11/15